MTMITLNILIALCAVAGTLVIAIKAKRTFRGLMAVICLWLCVGVVVCFNYSRLSGDGDKGLAAWQYAIAHEESLRVGFDLDGTLVYSRLNFADAFTKTKPLSSECYDLVNDGDERYSKIKTGGKKIFDKHRTRGDKIFVVTSRGAQNADKLKEYLRANFGVFPENVYFSGDDKTEVLKQLKLNWFYGDFDLDITSAQNAGVTPYRILLGEAEYQKPEKYNPGKFGETIILGTGWVAPGQEDWNQKVFTAAMEKEGQRSADWDVAYSVLAIVILCGLVISATYSFTRKNPRLPVVDRK